ncbi:hypothetical protein LguiA_029342 [Lonicera macranthoides]
MSLSLTKNGKTRPARLQKMTLLCHLSLSSFVFGYAGRGRGKGCSLINTPFSLPFSSIQISQEIEMLMGLYTFTL